MNSKEVWRREVQNGYNKKTSRKLQSNFDLRAEGSDVMIISV